MNSTSKASALLLLCLVTGHSQPISVQEAADARFNGEKGPIGPGFVSGSGQTVGTGPEGRVQLEYGDGIVRVGGQSSLEAQREGLKLNSGAFFFSRISDKECLILPGNSKDIRVSGDTGFVRVEPRAGQEPVLLIGAISGEVRVDVEGKVKKLASSDMLVLSGASITEEHFHLPRLLKSSRLISGFTSSLPDPGRLASAERDFNSLAQRGFVRSSHLSRERNGNLVAATHERRTTSQGLGQISPSAGGAGMVLSAREGILVGGDASARSLFSFRGLVLPNPGHNPHKPPAAPKTPHSSSHPGDEWRRHSSARSYDSVWSKCELVAPQECERGRRF